MSVPILPLYLIGIVLFIIGIEETEERTKSIIYLGIAFFASFIGYSLSYTDNNYLQASYFPLIIMIFSVVMLIYNAWQLLPHDLSMEEQAENEY